MVMYFRYNNFKDDYYITPKTYTAVGSPTTSETKYGGEKNKEPLAQLGVSVRREHYTDNLERGGNYELGNPLIPDSPDRPLSWSNVDDPFWNMTGISAEHLSRQPPAVAKHLETLYSSIHDQAISRDVYQFPVDIRRKSADDPTPRKSQEDARSYSRAGIQMARDYQKFKQMDQEGQVSRPTTLFEYHPPSVYFNSLFAHSTMKVPAMKLLGLAIQDHPNARLVASGDLSEHSSRLSKHAVDLGVPLTSPNLDEAFAQTNTYTFSDKKYEQEVSTGYHAYGEPIPKKEVSSAYQHMKGLLGRNKLSKQFDQVQPDPHPQLPGMENY